MLHLALETVLSVFAAMFATVRLSSVADTSRSALSHWLQRYFCQRQPEIYDSRLGRLQLNRSGRGIEPEIPTEGGKGD